ncbi:alkane 1-monooxygenase [Antrihabitans cavernicola]|nr:alkane 1-monooxygenase [Spelaeibacter cavernicola]
MVAVEGVPTWRDRKRYLWILSLITPGCAVIPSQLVLRTGQPIFWWLGPILIFVIIPVVDRLVGDDGENVPDDAYKWLSEDRFYRWCTFLFLPLLLAGLIIAGYMWASPELSVLDKIGLATTVGLISGVGINAAHELGHRVEEHERWLAKVALAQSCYGHFFVEHNRGHHMNVATPNDPASARLGERVWEFVPRSVIGGFRSAWQLEKSRLERKGSRAWSVHNNILQAWSMSVVLFGAMLAVFGPTIAPYLVLQAVVAFSMLEVVNYVEHYGLLRQQLPNGRYVRCSPRDSWNSDRLVTNIFMFHLQRHSDHHANPGRRYQTLRTSDVAPQLPAGYATMILLAMIPPLWRRVMDHRVVENYGGDITRTNLLPRRREKLLAAYGVDKQLADAA